MKKKKKKKPTTGNRESVASPGAVIDTADGRKEKLVCSSSVSLEYC